MRCEFFEKFVATIAMDSAHRPAKPAKEGGPTGLSERTCALRFLDDSLRFFVSIPANLALTSYQCSLLFFVRAQLRFEANHAS